jgi:hypothetical protein
LWSHSARCWDPESSRWQNTQWCWQQRWSSEENESSLAGFVLAPSILAATCASALGLCLRAFRPHLPSSAILHNLPSRLYCRRFAVDFTDIPYLISRPSPTVPHTCIPHALIRISRPTHASCAQASRHAWCWQPMPSIRRHSCEWYATQCGAVSRSRVLATTLCRLSWLWQLSSLCGGRTAESHGGISAVFVTCDGREDGERGCRLLRSYGSTRRSVRRMHPQGDTQGGMDWVDVAGVGGESQHLIAAKSCAF